MGRATVDVRSAGPADVDALLDVAVAARRATGQDPRSEGAGQRQRVLDALGRPELEVLLAEAGQALIGVLVLRRGEVLPLSGAPALHVEQLYVHPRWRRRGAARALLAAAAVAGEKAGLDRLACSTPPGDRETARFLARLGFLPLVTQRVVPVAVLLRRVRGENPLLRRGSAVEQLLAKRRREADRAAVEPTGLANAAPRLP